MSGTEALIEAAKKRAAYAAVDEFIRDGMKVGVGSGSTVVYVVERLVQRKNEEGLNITCIPTSFQSLNLINDGGLNLGDLNRHAPLDVSIDGADECDEKLNLIKGAALTLEKINVFNSKLFVVVADYRKESKVLGQKWKKGVPIEVLPLAWRAVSNYIVEHLHGKPILRMAVAKAGPVVTDNGNFILDVDFGEMADPLKVLTDVNRIPGVLETGLFVDMVEKAFFGTADGGYVTVDRKGERKVFQ
ncbi:ribose-5-phosphate isomerase-like [Planoprotostelium fungivorum]|uniref:ribose-5-phosphate isomerase n=1 Tax=Planoprotostelium fungivorum TaxID=1890364 RepID=A0A2P6NWG0_9EUKA|nr:ribose-5-phosphate isomerase-like [Planoprotostelium fungivorum]